MGATYNASVAALVDPLSNSPLNSPSHSGQHTEINDAFQTLGTWTSFTPVWTNLTVGNGTNVGSYVVFNKTMFLKTRFVMGSTSSMGTGPTLTIPGGFTISTTSQQAVGTAMSEDTGAATYIASAYILSSTSIRPYVANTAGTYAFLANITSAVPMTWGTSDVLSIDAVLELT